jgi:hypothetical protein
VNVSAELDISTRSIFAALLAAEVLLLVMDGLARCCIQSTELRELFDITLEANLPTWFSSTQALLVAAAAYLCGRIRAKHGLGYRRAGWLLLSVFFVYLGADDAASLHERVATALSNMADASGAETGLVGAFRAFPSYYWQALFGPVFLVMGAFIVIFMFRELGAGKPLAILILGLGCYAFAVGLDYFDGIDRNYDVVVRNTPYMLDDARHVFRALEEFLEMLGTTLILVTFLGHWTRLAQPHSRQPRT